ncbi:hypothetical protein A2U01_0096204, partial [Trifolium medium]|nr:hypothetical protein [Trifolium medium]
MRRRGVETRAHQSSMVVDGGAMMVARTG